MSHHEQAGLGTMTAGLDLDLSDESTSVAELLNKIYNGHAT